jgi:site-specific DNA recombinase
MLLIEEFERGGCQIEFLDQPMSSNPHDQLLVQIRGAVAEYERSLIAERMRRGRLQKYRAGLLEGVSVRSLRERMEPEARACADLPRA